jgi:hypothetical protein
VKSLFSLEISSVFTSLSNPVLPASIVQDQAAIWEKVKVPSFPDTEAEQAFILSIILSVNQLFQLIVQ